MIQWKVMPNLWLDDTRWELTGTWCTCLFSTSTCFSYSSPFHLHSMKFNKFISEPILLYTMTTMIATCSCRCGNNHRTLRCWNTHDLCCCTCHMDRGTSWLAGSVHDGKFGRLVMGTRESPCTNCLLKIMIYDIHFEIIFVTSSLTFSVSLKWVTEIQWTFYNILHAFTSRQCKFCWNDLSFTPTSNWILWIKFHLPSIRQHLEQVK